MADHMQALLQALAADITAAHADGLGATCLRADFPRLNELVRDVLVPAIDLETT